MTVTKDHTGTDLGATFQSALHRVAHLAILGVFRCFSTIAINSLYGPNKMQRLEEPEEEQCAGKKVQRLCMPQQVHLPSSRVMALVILWAQFYSYEKGRKNSISASKKT